MTKNKEFDQVGSLWHVCWSTVSSFWVSVDELIIVVTALFYLFDKYQSLKKHFPAKHFFLLDIIRDNLQRAWSKAKGISISSIWTSGISRDCCFTRNTWINNQQNHGNPSSQCVSRWILLFHCIWKKKLEKTVVNCYIIANEIYKQIYLCFGL